MTPQEKAEELVNKMYFSRRYLVGEDYFPEQAFKHAKQCAINAVDEILEISYWQYMESGGQQEQIYWQEVKHEIEKL